MKKSYFIFDWVIYRGEKYFAQSLNGKVHLHYCATAALNHNEIEKTISISDAKRELKISR